jgi:hypothetical protein
MAHSHRRARAQSGDSPPRLPHHAGLRDLRTHRDQTPRARPLHLRLPAELLGPPPVHTLRRQGRRPRPLPPVRVHGRVGPSEVHVHLGHRQGHLARLHQIERRHRIAPDALLLRRRAVCPGRGRGPQGRPEPRQPARDRITRAGSRPRRVPGRRLLHLLQPHPERGPRDHRLGDRLQHGTRADRLPPPGEERVDRADVAHGPLDLLHLRRQRVVRQDVRRHRRHAAAGRPHPDQLPELPRRRASPRILEQRAGVGHRGRAAPVAPVRVVRGQGGAGEELRLRRAIHRLPRLHRQGRDHHQQSRRLVRLRPRQGATVRRSGPPTR